VSFSGNLSGNLLPGKLLLYSSTGGLSSQLLDGTSVIVSSSTLSGNILQLSLIEQDLLRNDFMINTTTKSHLRLKSLSGWGIVGAK
jgi:hypothetical protein